MRKTAAIAVPMTAAVLLLLAIGTVGAQEDIERERFRDHNADVTFEWQSRRVFFYVSDGKDMVSCRAGTSATPRKELLAYAAFLKKIATGVKEHPDADWGWAKEGPMGHAGSNGVGFCNMLGLTRDGHILVSTIHNDACFGSAGCVTSSAMLALSPSFAIELSEAFKKYADLKPRW